MRLIIVVLLMVLSAGLFAEDGRAQSKAEKTFHAVATDAKGVETDINNVVFYWEEKLSETSFVPHELREMPLKRGAATVKIKFDQIKQLLIKPAGSGASPVVSITLNDGKTGEFALAIPGSFRGRSDFGEVELPAAELKQVVFH